MPVLGSRSGRVSDLLVDDVHVYWIVATRTGTVLARVPKRGGLVEETALPASSWGGCLADSGREIVVAAVPDGAIYLVAKDAFALGRRWSQLDMTPRCAIVLGSKLFVGAWTPGEHGQVVRFDLATAEEEVVGPFDGVGRRSDGGPEKRLCAGADLVVYPARCEALHACGQEGEAREVRGSSGRAVSSTAMIVRGDIVYFCDANFGISSLSLSTSSHRKIALNQCYLPPSSPIGIHREDLFWMADADRELACIYRLSITDPGDSPVEFFTGPIEIAVVEDALYWADRDGLVHRTDLDRRAQGLICPDRWMRAPIDQPETAGEPQFNSELWRTIDDIEELPEDALRSLWDLDIRYMGELVRKTEAELLELEHIDRAVIAIIKRDLATLGLALGTEHDGWSPDV